MNPLIFLLQNLAVSKHRVQNVIRGDNIDNWNKDGVLAN